ncbi:MAG: hypothetical protein RLZZ303_2458, partial [Candidatus Hydrogenedentota bacterium]
MRISTGVVLFALLAAAFMGEA